MIGLPVGGVKNDMKIETEGRCGWQPLKSEQFFISYKSRLQ